MKFVLALGWLSSAGVALAATHDGRPLVPTALAFRLDGVNAGRTGQWQGGDRYLRLLLPVSGDPKASAQAAVAPLEFELAVTEGGPWLALLQDFFRSSSAAHRLVVAEHFADRPGPVIEYTGARLEELVIDQVAGGGLLHLKVGAAAVGGTTEAPPLGNLPGGRPTGRGGFSVEVSGMTAGRFVADVGPIVLRAGAGGVQLAQPLSLHVQGGQQQPFRDWLDQTIDGTAAGRTVTVNLLMPDLRGVRLALTLTNALPLRVARDAENSRYVVELVSTQLSLASPTGPSATSSATTPPAAEATPAVATPAEPTPAPVTPTATLAKTDRTPALTKRPLAKAGEADQGLRDPSAFPRPSGLERLKYANTEYPSRQIETADYTGKMDPGELWQAYREAAASAGWKMESANESGTSPETVMIMSNWSQGQITTDLRLYAVKGGGVTVSISVTTEKAVRK